MTFTNDGSGFLYLDSPFRTSTFPWCNNAIYLMTDDAISQIQDNAEFKFTFYGADGTTVIETRTVVLPKRPLSVAGLNDEVFPALGVTSHALSAAGIGGTLTFPFTLPTAAKILNLYAELDFFSPTGSASNFNALSAGPDNDGGISFPPLNESSASIEVPAASRFTPTSAVLDFEAMDSQWRSQSVVWFYHE